MESIIFNNKKFVGRKQIVLDCKFSIDLSNEVDKVLSIYAKPIILSKKCEDGKIVFSGKLDTTFIYLAQNGQKICLVNVSEFSQIYENSEIKEGDEALIDCKVVDITTPSVKTNEVKVACIVDVGVSVVKSSNMQTQINCENPIVKETSFSKMNICQTISGNFDVVEEVKIQDSVSKVLKVDLHTVLEGANCNNGFLSLDIKARLNIVYVDEFDEVKVHKNMFSFRQEVEADKCSENSTSSINIIPLNYLGKTVVTQGDGFNLLKVQVPVMYSGEVYEMQEANIACDAYSVSQITNVVREEEEYIKECKNMFVHGECKGEVSLDDNINLVGVLSANCEVTNYTLDGAKLNVEGVVSATCLCQESKEVEQNEQVVVEKVLKPVRTDYAFAFSFDCPGVAENDTLTLCCGIKDIDATISSEMLCVMANIGFWANVESKSKCNLIKEINAIKEREPKTCAMEIFISEEEQDLWTLCKNVGLRQEDVIAQNPTLQQEVKKGDKIFIYYKVSAN